MSISVNSKIFKEAAVVADLAFSGTYASGGVSFDNDKLLGIHSVDLALIEPQTGYTFIHDSTNKKIKIFAPAPPIVYDEHQITSVSDIVTLNYPAAFIMNVSQNNAPFKMRSTGVTPAASQCSLVSQMAAGTKTQLNILSADQLSGDGAFTGGTTNWTFNAAPWTYGTNNLEKDAGGANTLTHDVFAGVVGTTYRLKLTLSPQGDNSEVIGSITPTLGGTAGAATTTDTKGTYTWLIKASTTDGLVLTPTTAGRFIIDSITVTIADTYITYVTQAWKDVWDNLVQDEAVTLATGANTLTSGNKMLACMYVDQITATAAPLLMIDEDDTAASGEILLKFNAATAQLAANAAQNAKACKITYVKVPTSGFLADRIFTNEGATKAGADPYTNTFDYPILLWAYCGQMPVNAGTTIQMVRYQETPATGQFVVDWFGLPSRGGGAPATGTQIGLKDNVTGTAAGVWGKLDEIPMVPLEVKDGRDLSSFSSVKGIFFGA
jgi:hypothetical protein